MIPLSFYVTLSAVLFAIGTLGFIVRRNAIVAFMSIELMLNAANIAFVAFARNFERLEGQFSVLFVMVVAAAEAAVGLAIVVSLYRGTKSVETSDADFMRG